MLLKNGATAVLKAGSSDILTLCFLIKFTPEFENQTQVRVLVKQKAVKKIGFLYKCINRQKQKPPKTYIFLLTDI